MTLREIIGLLRRRWYVLVAIVGVAVALSVFFVRDGGIYSTKTLVMFTLHSSTTLTPDNGSGLTGVIVFAGSVAAQVAPGGMTTRYYSHSDAPLYGVGLREAVSVGLSDSGTQWSVSHGQAIVEVEIVGRSEAWVERKQNEIVSIISGIAKSEQDAIGVPPSQRIEVHVEPMTKMIDYIRPSGSVLLLAVMAMLSAAVLLSFWGALLMDQIEAKVNERPGSEPAERRWAE